MDLDHTVSAPEAMGGATRPGSHSEVLQRLWEESPDLDHTMSAPEARGGASGPGSYSECSREEHNPSEAGDIAGETAVAAHTEKGKKLTSAKCPPCVRCCATWLSIAVVKTMTQSSSGKESVCLAYIS